MKTKFTQIRYAGHSGVFIDSEDFVVAIDPWIKNPLCPEELKNPKKLDLIILTHGHADHASDAPMLAKKTGAKVVATYELAQIMAKQGVSQDKLVFMNKGGSYNVGNLRVSLVNAFHSSSFDLESGPVYAGEACGVVVQDGQTSIYHAGDTALFSDMKLIGEIYKPDIALLPIGDCFTMGVSDAVIAAGFIGASKVIPIHHSTFPMLTGKPEDFANLCTEKFGDKITVQILKPGELCKL